MDQSVFRKDTDKKVDCLCRAAVRKDVQWPWLWVDLYQFNSIYFNRRHMTQTGVTQFWLADWHCQWLSEPWSTAKASWHLFSWLLQVRPVRHSMSFRYCHCKYLCDSDPNDANAYLHTKWHLDPCSPLATTDMGQKLGRGCAPLGRGAGSPSNTMCPGPRPTCMPSLILV